MTKKKRAALIAVLTLVLALAAFCLWYTRPVTADLPSCEEIQIIASYQTGKASSDEYELILTPEDPAFDQLLSLLEAQTYHRSLRNLLPLGGKTHAPQIGEFQWRIYIRGHSDTPGEFLLHITNFYGAVEINLSGKIWRVTVPNRDQWLSDVMDMIMAA